MLTKLICRNFKNFGDVEIELGNPVVFIGPNNSGKTTALQALALWEIGLKRWNEKHKGKPNPDSLPGVAINRRDLISVPVPNAKLLWRNMHVRNVIREDGKRTTKNIRIDIIVQGVTDGKAWECGFEFDYANEESFYCRPLRTEVVDGKITKRMSVTEEAATLSVAFLPPMSGLASNEIRLEPGTVGVRIGEGRTAEVLRNLCYQISENMNTWNKFCKQIHDLFGVYLDKPDYISERGEIVMSYRDAAGITFDLSSSGRGLQQTLLLLAYIAAHPGSVLLLDEPDAHLEILRQRQIYQVLTETANEYNSQIIAASHSEVILTEAAERDVVIAFLGKPHRIDDRGSQLLKSLKTIGFEQYYQAEQRGWVLYLEGATDLAILRAFSQKLEHASQDLFAIPFVEYVGNQPGRAREHFYGLLEAKSNLVGFSLFDRIPDQLHSRLELTEYAWKRCEIENYIINNKQVLIDWVRAQASKEVGELFITDWVSKMEDAIEEIENALITLGKGTPWSPDIKVSTDFLEPLFKSFYSRLNIPNLMQKTNYHSLVKFVSVDQIDPEITDVLDGILEVAEKAVPLSSI